MLNLFCVIEVLVHGLILDDNNIYNNIYKNIYNNNYGNLAVDIPRGSFNPLFSGLVHLEEGTKKKKRPGTVFEKLLLLDFLIILYSVEQLRST